MEITNCIMTFDEHTETVTIRKQRTGCILLSIKLETASVGTMTRIDPLGFHDADNYWIGVKPSDFLVFDQELFGRNKLSVTNFEFKLS